MSHSVMFLAIMMGFIAFEPIILLYSLITGIICLLFYTIAVDAEPKKRKFIREFLIDGESITLVCLRGFIFFLFPQSALYNN